MLEIWLVLVPVKSFMLWMAFCSLHRPITTGFVHAQHPAFIEIACIAIFSVEVIEASG